MQRGYSRLRTLAAFWMAASILVPHTASADSFTDALRSTYQTNPRIKAERQALQATDELSAQALSGFRPDISADYSYGRQRSDFGNSGWNYNNGTSKGLTVEQPLFRGGTSVANLGSARQRIKAGQNQLDATEQAVMLQAITAYLDVVQAQAILELARANEKVLAKQMEGTQQRFEYGDVTRTDVAQSQARYSNAKASTANAEGDVVSAMATFERVVGYKPETTLDVPQNYPAIPASLEEALRIARAQNPSFLATVHTEKSANYDVSANIGTLLPQVSLLGTMSRDENAGVGGNAPFDQDAVKLNVRIPLYQSGAEYARIREAKARARQRSEQRTDTLVSVVEETTKAWEELETSIATITARDDQIKAAEIALDGVKQEHEYGARTVLDVLDAEQELYGARVNLVRAHRDRIVAVYNLVATLGQLTPENLEIGMASYDPEINYDDVKWQFIGF